MKRFTGWAAALMLAAACTGAATAADIRRPPPPAAKAPAYVPPPAFSWTGFYLGANVGYGWSDGSGRLFPGSIPFSGDGDGFLGGVQGGYNWQMGNVVIGAETDFQLSAGDGTVTSSALAPSTFGKVDNEWFGTIRARLGYAVDRWLFYVTGGGAYTHNKLRAVAPYTFASTSETGWTWTVGGGIEAALWQNWSVKGEYLYLGTPDDVPTPPGTRADGDVDTHLIRLGVNYHF